MITKKILKKSYEKYYFECEVVDNGELKIYKWRYKEERTKPLHFDKSIVWIWESPKEKGLEDVIKFELSLY